MVHQFSSHFWHCVSLCATVYRVVMPFFAVLSATSSLLWCFHQNFPVPAWISGISTAPFLERLFVWLRFLYDNSTDRAVIVALWLLCLLTLVHVKSWQEHLAKSSLCSADCNPQDEWRKNLSLHLQEVLQAGQEMALQLSVACHPLETLNHTCCLFF